MRQRLAAGWVKRAIEQAHTLQEWTEIFRALPPEKKVAALIRIQPCELQGKIDNQVRVIFTMTGLKGSEPLKVEAHSSPIHSLPAAALEDDEDAT